MTEAAEDYSFAKKMICRTCDLLKKEKKMTTKAGDPNKHPRYVRDDTVQTVGEQLQDIHEKKQAYKKTLHNSDVSGARKNVKDIQVVGNGDMFQLLCKASSEKEGWMKSTKAMNTGTGCLVQVTTQQRNPDGSYAIAEALSFVPGVHIVPDEKGGRRLEAYPFLNLSTDKAFFKDAHVA